MPRPDPHSFNDSDQPEIAFLDWTARVDFAARRIEAEARLDLRAPGGGPLDLDTRDLEILSAADEKGAPIAWDLAPADPILGSRLRLTLPATTTSVTVRYRTSPTASALQWLEPAQTAGGRHPYLFSQCQAIHARSVVPLQDTPRLRIRFRARMTVPAELRALMAAAFVSREAHGAQAVETWEMPQPIPPYLFAFAAGDLDSRDVGPRSRVWSEPSVVERAAWEFAGIDDMLRTAESMFGPYPWDRYDVLCMPPSFPYGGMENPRLSFVTPTLLAGDRSLVNVIAHELAHSWTGNLVTNATAEHFWLNEGFTVFAERRIQQALSGPEITALHAALGRRELGKACERFKDRPELTRLRTHLSGVDPDESYSEVPYEKGYLFLRTLEEASGRAAFDKFLRRYIDAYRFQSITTEEFESFARRELPGALEKADSEAWLRGAGVPANAPAVRSSRLEAVERLGAELPPAATAASFTPTEWQLWLESLPHPAGEELCRRVDDRFRLTESRNHEVLVTWLVLGVESGWAPALARAVRVLGQVGRMKYLRPLFRALNKRDPAAARDAFAKYRDSYHPIARQVVEGLLAKG